MNLEFSLERELNFESAEGVVKGVLTIGRIVQQENLYACEYDIPLIDNKKRNVYGEDPIHALMLCLKHIRGRLDSASTHQFRDIWWLEPGDHGGF